MKLRTDVLLLTVLLLSAALPALAQVNKVAIKTKGIACGDCAAVSQINLGRMDGVEKVVVNASTEALLITYKAGAVFQPEHIREILDVGGVGVLQFQIGAR